MLASLSCMASFKHHSDGNIKCARATSLKKCAKMDIAIVEVAKDREHEVSIPIYNSGDKQTIAWQDTPLPMFI